MMQMRFFEITGMREDVAEVVVEYFGDFGGWVCKKCAYCFPVKVGREIWVVASDIRINSTIAGETCKTVLNDQPTFLVVDLDVASNPINERQPAMRKKAKK